MKLSTGILVLVAAICVTPAVSHGIPGDHITQVNSEAEYDAIIEEEHRRLSEAHANLRARVLQETGNADSLPILADYYGGEPGFYHSVASGDPLEDAVIIWTRYTPASVDEVIELEFRMAAVDPNLVVEDHLDPEKNPNLRRGFVTVTSASDFVAKIDVTGLESGTDFVFAFSQGDNVSDVGQTKTAPANEADVQSLTYAVFSCAHFANGYFHSYDLGSTIKDIDFWIHVGDYLYEYGLYSTYASNSPERKEKILPVWEQISLQDHRNRHVTYLLDEGLLNMRRRAPMLGTWDDHETTNNAYGMGAEENTGAQNHQPVCTANSTSPDGEKAAESCDRDEGTATDRFNAAAQAYLEYLPLRTAPGTMGVVTIGTITQVIEWGKLATFVLFDTRITARSKEPSLKSSNFGAFGTFAQTYPNSTEWMMEGTDAAMALQTLVTNANETSFNENYTMIGENIEILRENFAASTAADKVWQIWGAATAMGPANTPDFFTIHNLVEDATQASQVRELYDGLISAVGFFGGASAMAMTGTFWNYDDFNGFGVERAAILDMLKENTNNPIILAGDLHDSYAWTMYEGGANEGTPCAVNLVCPGVTSPGFGGIFYNQDLADILGSEDAAYRLVEKADEDANPGLQYWDMQHKGFFVVKATKETHVAEYFGFKPSVTLTNFTAARAASDGLTAEYVCRVSLTTTAGEPGSLVRNDECSAIEIDTERPAVWGLPYPLGIADGDAVHLTDCGYDQCEFDGKLPVAVETSSAACFSVAGVVTAVAAIAALL